MLFKQLVFIVNFDETFELKRVELSQAKIENLSFIDFVEMALDLKYKIDILSYDPWYAKKKLLRDRLNTDNRTDITIFDVLTIESILDTFGQHIYNIFKNIDTFICDRINIINVRGKEVYLSVNVIEN